MEEQFFQCPYCWEDISMLIDTSINHQSYVEDCEVCCNPIEVTVTCSNNEITSISPAPLGQ
ncbi:MAG: CPXCG motif-containing cysteine-rich protein [Psychroflexus sp.]|nr:CPXCG motif-containing cysteine-rich protein [Psychroflexus sp.]MDR9448504.1 CPXCG motif-containing cysteine-rich protein [Psychroflexus sp.]